MTNEHDFDKFERWLMNCPSTELPSKLRDGGVATIPVEKVSRRQRLDRLWGDRLVRLVGGAIALTAAAIAASLIMFSRDSSVFAQAVAESRDAAIIHIIETSRDPELFGPVNGG